MKNITITIIISISLIFSLSQLYSQTNQNKKLVINYYSKYDIMKLKPDLKHEIPKRLFPSLKSIFIVYSYLDNDNKTKIVRILKLKEDRKILTIYDINDKQLITKQGTFKLDKKLTIKEITDNAYKTGTLIPMDSMNYIKHGWFYNFIESTEIEKQLRVKEGIFFDNDKKKAWDIKYESGNIKSQYHNS